MKKKPVLLILVTLVSVAMLFTLVAEAAKYRILLGTNKVWRVHRSGVVKLVNKNVPLDKYHQYLRHANYIRKGQWIMWAGPCAQGGIAHRGRRVIFKGYPKQEVRTAPVRGGECVGIETINPAGIRTAWFYYVITP